MFFTSEKFQNLSSLELRWYMPRFKRVEKFAFLICWEEIALEEHFWDVFTFYSKHVTDVHEAKSML